MSLIYSWILRDVLPRICPSIELVVVTVKELNEAGNPATSLVGRVRNCMGTLEGRRAISSTQWTSDLQEQTARVFENVSELGEARAPGAKEDNKVNVTGEALGHR